jgi:hypothetical protein
MTVLIYVDTRKQVGDPEHLKVLPQRPGLRRMTPKAWASNTRCSSGRCSVRFRREWERWKRDF